jgi:glycerophosphoryl diester phosphodiesterase
LLAHRLVAHRGYQKKYPENTLLSVVKALEQGARHIEVDIQFTADLQPLLYHDPTLVRVSGLAREMRHLLAEEALAAPASEPYRLGQQFKQETICHLHDLAAVIHQHPELTVFVELKEEAIEWVGIDKAYTAVTDILHMVKKQVVLISFHHAFIIHARQQGWPKVGLVLHHWLEIENEICRRIEPDYLFASQALLPETRSLPPLDSLLVVYEIAEPQQAIELFRRGVDMVETFDIGGMMAGLASHSL